MMKRLLLVFLLLNSAACVSLDSIGTVDEKRSNANKVLLALSDYQSELGNLPKSLDDLIPKYLNDIPVTPAIRFNRMEESLYYDENSDWMGNTIVCSAKVGSDYWRCRKHQ